MKIYAVLENIIMKKILIIFILFFIIAFIALGYHHYILINNTSAIMIELDLLDNSEAKASEILYNHFKNTAKLMPKISDAEIESVKLNQVKAFEIDLNNDNKNEIIGVIYSPLTKGRLGYEFFVLEKIDNNNYRNLSWSLTFTPQAKVYILTTKHNGYRNILLKGSQFFGSKYLLARYENEMYYNDKLTKAMMYFSYFSTKTR